MSEQHGWTEELMTMNGKLHCDDCGHPIAEHYFPEQPNELLCDVPYCEWSRTPAIFSRPTTGSLWANQTLAVVPHPLKPNQIGATK